MKGWFDAFRYDGGPTLYSFNNRTAVTGDVTLITFLTIFCTLYVAFLIIFPGIRKERFTTFFAVTLSLFVGATILVTLFGSAWHVGSARVVSTYRAFSKEKISSNLGVYVGLRHVNITLQASTSSNWTGDIDYNEQFLWLNSDQMGNSFREAMVRGLPFPILTVAEYFTMGQEGLSWGGQYRAAGYYAVIMLWTSFSVWILMNLMLIAVPRYGAVLMTTCGFLMLATACGYFALLPETPLVVHIEGSTLHFSFGWCYWLVLIAGSACLVSGVLITALEIIFPHSFSTILEVDYDTPYDRHIIIEDSRGRRFQKKRSSNGKLEEPEGIGTKILRRLSSKTREEKPNGTYIQNSHMQNFELGKANWNYPLNTHNDCRRNSELRPFSQESVNSTVPRNIPSIHRTPGLCKFDMYHEFYVTKMGLSREFAGSCIHLSLGLTILIGLTASEYSGAVTIVALPISAIAVTLSALCGESLSPTDATYKKRKLCDILDFLKIWFEVLELLAASATCARIASATIDYITNQKMREWFLGIESHSLGEPWPDILGVSIVIVITGLFMLGLEKSSLFTGMLFVSIVVSCIFFLSIGSSKTVCKISAWSKDFKTCSLQSVLSAAALCSYGFVNTFPKINKHKTLKIIATIVVPILVYFSTVMVFTLMSREKKLAGTAIPLVTVFQLRDVDLARLIMSICIICVVCLALTEIFPSLYELFETLAGREWQIFLASLLYKNSLTGTPLLAIFAAGSLAAILAFACPLSYLVRTMNAATLFKCIFKSLLVLFFYYRPEFRDECFLVSSTNTQYSKLKQSSSGQRDTSFKLKNKVTGILSNWRKNLSPKTKGDKSPKRETPQDNEYLLLNDYCDKSADVSNVESSDENDDRESVLSSDVEESNSSTDIDATVQEYKDKIQVATIDNFNDNKYPTHVTATTVIIFMLIIVTSTITLSQVVLWKIYNLIWPCFTVSFFSTLIVMVMPKNSYDSHRRLLPTSVTPMCNMLAVQLHILLVSTLMVDIWPGFIFWTSVGCLLFWRCECCTCDGLLTNNQKSKLNITENMAQYPDNYVDTILISR